MHPPPPSDSCTTRSEDTKSLHEQIIAVVDHTSLNHTPAKNVLTRSPVCFSASNTALLQEEFKTILATNVSK